MGVTSLSPSSLPGLLHSGSSVITDEHPHLKINIASPTPEEQDATNLPLGGGHATLAVAAPKTPWRPRVTLTAEVDKLLTQGMTEDYDREPEHSAQWQRSLLPKQTHPHHQRQKCQPCHWTLPLRPVLQRWRPPWRVIPSMILPQQWPIAATVTVQQWTFLSFRPMPT